MKREPDTKELVVNRFNAAKDAVQTLQDDWYRYYQMYRSYREEDTKSFSNLFIPHTFSTIEQILPRLVSGIFGSTPTFSVEPRKPEDVYSAKATETLINWQFKQRRVKNKVQKALKDALMYGTGIIKEQWIEDKHEFMGQEIEEYVGPEPMYVSPFTFYPDPHATGIKDADYVCENYFVTMEELKQWEKQGKVGSGAGGTSIQEFERQNNYGGRNESDSARFQRLAQVGKMDTGHTDTTRDWVEIIEYWENGRVVIIGNENEVLRDEENPYANHRKPYFAFKNYETGDEFFGIGEIEIIEDLQEEINTQRNQRIDARSLSLNPIVQVSPGAMVDNDEIVFEPGRIWRIEPGAVQPFALPDTGTASVQEEEIATQNIKETTSVTDIVKGQATQRTPDTATGVSRLDVNAATRFNMKVRDFEGPLTEMVKHGVQMNEQYLTRTQAVKITGEMEYYTENAEVKEEGPFRFVNVEPAEITHFADYKVKGAKSVTQMQRQQKLMQVLQVGGQFSSEFNVKEVLRRLFEAMEVVDIDKILSVEEEQIQRMQRMGGGQGQRGGPQSAEQVMRQAAQQGGGPPTSEVNRTNVPRQAAQTPESANQETLSAIRGGV